MRTQKHNNYDIRILRNEEKLQVNRDETWASVLTVNA